LFRLNFFLRPEVIGKIDRLRCGRFGVTKEPREFRHSGGPALKSILVPVENNDLVTSIMECAAKLASSFSSIIDGVAIRLPQVSVVGPDPVVTVTFPRAEQEDAEILSAARATFDAFFNAQAPAERGPRPYRYRWRGGEPLDDTQLGSLARVFDLTVVGRPQGGVAGPRMTTFESVLFESGRPILIAPPRAPLTLGERIVISWNCSTESSRTVAYALPLLAKAREVTVMTVEGSTVPGPAGKELVDYLGVHGIEARELTVLPGGRKHGAAILEEAQRLGGDLLIKGAYTQSRLRQMIFGGATSHIVAHTEMPVFMAH
jgi:nucleotide-binding universal stress UspA family protein